MSKIIVTTVFTDAKYNDEDAVYSDVYENNAERHVDQLCLAMVGFVVNTDIIDSERMTLRNYFRNGNYEMYYKTIEKIAKNARKSLGNNPKQINIGGSMPLPERNHSISKEEKAELIQNLTAQKVSEGFDVLHVKHRFHADQVRALLSNEKAVEFVVEKGADADGAEVMILTTYDADGNESDDTLNRGVLCPPICG